MTLVTDSIILFALASGKPTATFIVPLSKTLCSNQASSYLAGPLAQPFAIVSSFFFFHLMYTSINLHKSCVE